MLKNLDPLLNADVLHALHSMGHGDELVICDANFPADAIARKTVIGTLLRIDAVSSPRALKAVLSVIPLDTFVDAPALRMEVVGAPQELPAAQREAILELEASGEKTVFAPLERMAFYERAKQAYCVIMTGEQRGYGCFILKKGVLIAADAESRPGAVQ
ncbi:RbsD/FucU family protein [Pararobbsia silviterrae]|uniref:Ribose ABC transporter n=1 Tax=Pararobbsia silviterrae TaxID=1792498 RepID=A0A494XVD8_9BURK|nr:RbsD/FucU domain-containing protein [Pararobbsia silviterrae]RKP54583.1 ribose ABC transporter [Pararobbsia silviterrae]